MLSPEKWEELVATGTGLKSVRREIAQQIRIYLATLAPGITVTTKELVETLYQPRYVSDMTIAGDDTRIALYKVIVDLARTILSDCCVKGEIQGQYMGKPKRPWLWFCPEDMEICSGCGQVLPKEYE